MFFFNSVLWMINSDNFIETGLGLKKFIVLFLAFLGTFSVFLVQSDELILSYTVDKCNINAGLCFEFTLIFSETSINLILFSILITECINRLGLFLFDHNRIYSRLKKRFRFCVYSFSYYLLSYLYLVIHNQNYEIGKLVVNQYSSFDIDSKIWLAFYCFWQIFIIWNTFFPVFNEILFIHTLFSHLCAISLITFVLLSFISLPYLLGMNSFLLSGYLIYPAAAAQSLSAIVLIVSAALIRFY